MIIYCAENKITGKKYIGKTAYSLQKRKQQHESNAFIENEKTVFYCALRKYGMENFEWSIIENNIEENKEIINEKETYWIKKLNTYYKNGGNGYNMTYGGDGGCLYDQTGRTYTEETIKKMSKSLKKYFSENDVWNKGRTYKDDARIVRMTGEKNGMCGKTHTPETREKMRLSHLGKPPGNKGISPSSETREKIRQKMLGRKVTTETNIKKILSRNKITYGQLVEIKNYVLENGITEENIIYLSEKYNVPRSMIRNIKEGRIWNYIKELQ